MKTTISTNTYKITVDDRLKPVAKNHEFFTLADAEAPKIVQAPILNMALSEIRDLTEEPEFAGETYSEKLLSYFKTKRYKVELLGDLQSIEIAGKNGYFQKAVSQINHQGKDVKIHHYFINVPLDDEFMLEISADCEEAQRETYEPLFWQAIHSTELLGNYRQFLDVQNKAFAERLAQIEARLENANATAVSIDEADDLSELPPIPPIKIPQQEVCKIADFEVAFTTDCKWFISDFSKEVCFEINIDFADKNKAINDKLLSEFSDGTLKLSFGADGIYQHGKPQGKFHIDKGKTADHKHFRDNELHYGLEFSGEVVFTDNWVAILGWFHDEYDFENRFSVEVYKQFNVADLDWKNYQFNLNELSQAHPEIVRFVAIYNADLRTFPNEILACKNLQNLSIYGFSQGKNFYTSDERSSLSEIPEALGNLTSLQELTFSRLAIKTLPESLGKLHQLRRLYVMQCPLENYPDALFSLKNLQLLSITDTQIYNIPEQIDEPGRHKFHEIAL